MPQPLALQRAAWKRVFQEFDAACDRYVGLHCARDAEGRASIDVPWFHTERATLSMLAGAIWRAHADNLVLEEYSSDKTGDASSYKGRRDIWFQLEGRQYWGEAKQTTGDLEDADAVLRLARETARGELDAVLADAGGYPNRTSMGLCFVSWKGAAPDAFLPQIGPYAESLTEFDGDAGEVRHHCFPVWLRRLYQAEHCVAPGDRDRWFGVTLVLKLAPYQLG